MDAYFALICETKFGIEIGSEGLPSNYEIIRKDRKGGRREGVCIMIKKLQVGACQKLNSVDARQIEQIWCKIKSAVGEGMITIEVIYRPPNISQDDNIKLNQLLECAEGLTKK